jgi:DNA invertase Pin-like site-specific DNA recombinase
MERLIGCDKIFSEKKSGTKIDDREQLKICIEFVREGDTLVVTRVDRLARSIADFFQVLKILESKKVELVVLDQSIDTSTIEGRLMLSIVSAFAEFETAIRKERQMEGLQKAKNLGVQLGRRKSLTNEQILDIKFLKESGSSISEIASKFGVSRASVYNYLA